MNEVNDKLLYIDLGYIFMWDGIIFRSYILSLENLEAFVFVWIKTLEQYTPCIVTSQWRCDVTVVL